MSSAHVVNFNIIEVQMNDTNKCLVDSALEECETFTISGNDLLTFAVVSLVLCLFSIQVLCVIFNIAGWKSPCDLEVPFSFCSVRDLFDLLLSKAKDD